MNENYLLGFCKLELDHFDPTLLQLVMFLGEVSFQWSWCYIPMGFYYTHPYRNYLIIGSLAVLVPTYTLLSILLQTHHQHKLHLPFQRSILMEMSVQRIYKIRFITFSNNGNEISIFYFENRIMPTQLCSRLKFIH